MFGLAYQVTSSYRTGLVSLLVFFVAGTPTAPTLANWNKTTSTRCERCY